MRKRKEEKEGKPNNLNGCNYVLPPDKLLAGQLATPLSTALATVPFSYGPSWHLCPISLRETSLPDREHGDLDNVCVCIRVRVVSAESSAEGKMQKCVCAWKS